MRIIFPNIDRAKKSAKGLKSSLQDITLSTAQNNLAKISGFRDWHELNQAHKQNSISNIPPVDEGNQLAKGLALRLSNELEIGWSTALYAISKAHIIGIDLSSMKIYESVWLEIMQKKYDFSNQRHSIGSIVKLKVSGHMGEPCYLKRYGKPTYLVSHDTADTMVADFEITVPRIPLEPFVPARLKYAYGYWVEEDGAKVLFSRDYKPLWRIRKNRIPERIVPWLWVDKIDEHWFWGEENSPWYKQSRFDEEEARLEGFGIKELPILADVLPNLIFNPRMKSIDDAVDAFAKREDPSVIETFHGCFKMKVFT